MADQNRDGVDDNIDRKPGNDRDSPSFARIYDPRSELEFTNLAPVQEQIEARTRANLQARQRETLKRARDAVHFFPSVGKFIIPRTNTWVGHAAIVLDNDSNLFFNPEKYVHFDKIIAEKLNLPALTDRNHPDFHKYRGLRTNLEVLRNDIIGQYLNDGGFDPGDEAYIPKIQAVATALGTALANDVWWKRPFTNYFSVDVANIEAVGASELYKFLLSEQDKNPNGSTFKQGLREMFGMYDTHWGLKNLEDTPFSPEGLAAPPPASAVAAPAATNNATEMLPKEREIFAGECCKLVNACCNFAHIDTLNIPDRKDAVEDGRTILRWLRNLEFGDRDTQEFLEAGSPPEQIAKADALSKLITIYASQMAKASRETPELLGLPDVKNGSDAAGGAALMIGEHALSLLPEDSDAYKKLEAAIDAMPAEHHTRSTQSLSRLLDHMEQGFATLTRKELHGKAAPDRLLEAAERLRVHAKKLRSVDTMAEPTREESVELGREILRKLRNLLSNNKSAFDALDTGKPEEKAANASKLEEMVELYQNLLAEVVSVNPGLMNDPRIKEANDAVGGFAHAIALLAAKEVPNSVASAQKISADVTQDPHEWKKLHDHTVDRLLKSMEGGLEAAVQEMDQQQAEQQQDDEVSQQQAESALAATDQSRRRRRRRRQQKSGISGKASDKKMREIMADDRAAGQGRFREDNNANRGGGASPPSPYIGLKASDIAAVASLGSALRDAGNAGSSLAMANASLDSPVKPDDKSAAERAIEAAIQSRRSNRNRPAK